MSKVELNADIIKNIIVGVLKDSDITDKEKLMKLSNLDDNSFYVRKLRLDPAKDYIEQLTDSIHKGYCLIDLLTISRIFNANMDFVTVVADLTFWVQTKALPFLDRLIDRTSIAVCGERYQLPDMKDIDGNPVSRSAVIAFTPLIVDEIKEESEIGESAKCKVTCSMNITENLAIDGEVQVDISLKVKGEDTEPTLFENISVIEKNIATSANTRPLTQTNLQALGVSKTANILAVSFSTYCPISDYGKALERLVAAYSTKDKKTLNETVHIKVTFPNGNIIEEDMVCTSAKSASNLTDPVVMSFIFSPKTRIGEYVDENS